MKKMIFRWLKGKIIAPFPVDLDDFCSKIGDCMQADRVIRTDDGHLSLRVRNRMLFVSYNVEMDILHRRIRYSYGNENIATALIVMVFAGLVLFKGRLDTYIFWAALATGAICWINNMLTHSRIRSAILAALPRRKPGKGNIIGSAAKENKCSITQQSRCGACGCVLNGFGSVCPGCGIRLGPSSESSSRLDGWSLKYFYREK